MLISAHPRSWDSGSSLVYLHLDEELRRLGHDVTLLTEEDYLPSGTSVTVRKLFGPLIVKRRALEMARRADIVEVPGDLGWSLFGALRAGRSGRERPLLVSRLHGLAFLDEQARFIEEIAGSLRLPIKYKLVTRHWVNWQDFRSLALSDMIACYTSRDVDAIVVRRLKAEEDVTIAPPGVEARYFRPRAYREAGRRLLWWGTWIERKGIAEMPRALELVSRAVPGVTLTIGGSGARPETLLGAFPPGLRDKVTVLPFVTREQHLDILDQHDVFVFPSLSEGFGLALAEAMASGLPSVTTFTGLAHDWLEHGRNALLVPMRAPTALAREVRRLLEDVDLRRTIGANGQRTARQWTWDAFGRSTATLYAQYLARLRGAAVPVADP